MLIPNSRAWNGELRIFSEVFNDRVKSNKKQL